MALSHNRLACFSFNLHNFRSNCIEYFDWHKHLDSFLANTELHRASHNKIHQYLYVQNTIHQIPQAR